MVGRPVVVSDFGVEGESVLDFRTTKSEVEDFLGFIFSHRPLCRSLVVEEVKVKGVVRVVHGLGKKFATLICVPYGFEFRMFGVQIPH